VHSSYGRGYGLITVMVYVTVWVSPAVSVKMTLTVEAPVGVVKTPV